MVRVTAPLDAPYVGIEIPANLQELESKDIARASKWQEAVCTASEELFAAGYAVRGFDRMAGSERCRYILTKG